MIELLLLLYALWTIPLVLFAIVVGIAAQVLLFLVHSFMSIIEALATIFRSSIVTLTLAFLDILYWCFSPQHFSVTISFVHSLEHWIPRFGCTCAWISVIFILKVYGVVKRIDTLLYVASLILQAVIWMTSSWPLRLLATFAAMKGFEAWISRSGRFDIFSIAVVLFGVQIYIFTFGRVNIMTIAAVFISLRAYIATTPRLKPKLICVILLGGGIYVFNPKCPNFTPVAVLMMGLSAYIISIDSGNEDHGSRPDIAEVPRPRARERSRARPTGQRNTPLEIAASSIRPRLSRPRIVKAPQPRRLPNTRTPLALQTVPSTLPEILGSAPSVITTPPNQSFQVLLCTVCGEDRPLSEFSARPTGRCFHLSSICKDDLRDWIQSQLSSTLWNRIRCPETGCNEVFQYDDMIIHASEEAFERYSNFQIRSTLSQISDFHWCLNANCESGQIHPQFSSNPILTCISCGHKSCATHNIPWHEGETCDQYAYRVSGRKLRDEERATESMIKKTTKHCPGCKANIEKIDGCDHMTCSSCRTEFCWLCFVDYRLVRQLGNAAHRGSCHYHTRNLR